MFSKPVVFDVDIVGVIINDFINTVEMSTVSVVKSKPTSVSEPISHDMEMSGERSLSYSYRALASSTTVVKNIIYVDKSYPCYYIRLLL